MELPFKYGKKNIQKGDTFSFMESIKAECIYSSEQVLRFKLTWDNKELHLQKFLLLKMRQPWRIIYYNFMFNEGWGREINKFFYHLDDYIKPKNRYDRSDKN
jgi:hypothetical protein